jgi:hypothetical protein
MWDGGSCVILGGGESIRLLSPDLVAQQRAIAVNCAAIDFPRSEVFFWGDAGFPQRWAKELQTFQGLKVSCCASDASIPGVRFVRKLRDGGPLTTNPRCVRWNSSSGAAAINLAVHFGVKRIILCGFDMHKREDGHNNYHDRYAPGVGIASDPFRRFLAPFKQIAVDLERLEIECVNASPGSAIATIQIVDPRSVGLAP